MNETAPAFEDRPSPTEAIRRLRERPSGDAARQAAEVVVEKALDPGGQQQAVAVHQPLLDPHTSDWNMAVLRGALLLLRNEYEHGDPRLKPAVTRRVNAVLEATGFRASDLQVLREAFPSDVNEVMRLLGH